MEVSTKTLLIRSQNLENPTIVHFNDKENLLDILNANNISISQSCAGSGTCTTCRVFILNNLKSVSKRTEIETEIAQERNFTENERLACQCEIFDSLEIYVTVSML